MHTAPTRHFKGGQNYSTFLNLPFELRDRIYRLLLQDQAAIQVPRTPARSPFSALKRRTLCTSPETWGNCAPTCPVHGNGLQVLKICKFIRNEVMKLFKGSYCDILINEHGIFRNYRIPPTIKHKIKHTVKEVVSGAFGESDGFVEKIVCENHCDCKDQRGLRISIQLSPFIALDERCWEKYWRWCPPCLPSCPRHYSQPTGTGFDDSWTLLESSTEQWIVKRCPCREREIANGVLGVLFVNKGFWTVRENVYKFIRERWAGIAEHHSIQTLVRAEFVGFCENRMISGDYSLMLKSVLLPFLKTPRPKGHTINVQYWPRFLEMRDEYWQNDEGFNAYVPDDFDYEAERTRMSMPWDTQAHQRAVRQLNLHAPWSRYHNPLQQDRVYPFPATAYDATLGVHMQLERSSIDVDPLFSRWITHHFAVFCAQEKRSLDDGQGHVMIQNTDLWPKIEAILQDIQVHFNKGDEDSQSTQFDPVLSEEDLKMRNARCRLVCSRHDVEELLQLASTAPPDDMHDIAWKLNEGLCVEITSGDGKYWKEGLDDWLERARSWADAVAKGNYERGFPSFSVADGRLD